MSPYDIHRVFGGQHRAGKPLQRNAGPVTTHYTAGWRALISRALRWIFERS
jgi:hypothetical protein